MAAGDKGRRLQSFLHCLAPWALTHQRKPFQVQELPLLGFDLGAAPSSRYPGYFRFRSFIHHSAATATFLSTRQPDIPMSCHMTAICRCHSSTLVEETPPRGDGVRDKTRGYRRQGVSSTV
ncbi:hypothetical protein LY78DRAFT_423416 [Colletotrichum sublineola]|nr:hypothetical protein LY78DRAFT_423416 [Colletotrichum sublineola]